MPQDFNSPPQAPSDPKAEGLGGGCRLLLPDVPGSAEMTVGWDMTGRDAATVHKAISERPRRWRALDDKKKDNFVTGLDEAQTQMRAILAASVDTETATEAAKAIASIVKTAVAIEGQEQTDEWNHDKNNRLDAGKATSRDGQVNFTLKIGNATITPGELPPPSGG